MPIKTLNTDTATPEELEEIELIRGPVEKIHEILKECQSEELAISAVLTVVQDMYATIDTFHEKGSYARAISHVYSNILNLLNAEYAEHIKALSEKLPKHLEH